MNMNPIPVTADLCCNHNIVGVVPNLGGTMRRRNFIKAICWVSRRVAARRAHWRRDMRRVLSLALALFVAGITSGMAENYPSRPITIVVPFPAGGPTDALGRVLADRMKRTLNARSSWKT
jgi:hypothetical protein